MNCVISWRRQQQDSSTSCPIREPSPLKVWAAFVERMNRGSARRILVPRMLFCLPFRVPVCHRSERARRRRVVFRGAVALERISYADNSV
jgi:hypothetical protein